jgi:hypothetical protein
MNEVERIITEALTAEGYTLAESNGIVVATHPEHGSFDFTKPEPVPSS